MEYGIGFDRKRNCVRFLGIEGETTEYWESPVSAEAVRHGFYERMLEEAMQGRSWKGASIRVVLPEEAYACDFFRLPVLKSGMKQAIKTEFETFYPQAQKLKYHSAIYRQSRKYVTNAYVLMSQSIWEQISHSIQAQGGVLRGITTAAFGTACAVHLLDREQENSHERKPLSQRLPKRKAGKGEGAVRVFADVQPHCVRYVLLDNGQPLCSRSQPFGFCELMQEGSVPTEKLLQNSAAENYVNQIMEAARKQRGGVLPAKEDKQSNSPEVPVSGMEDNFSIVQKYALLMVQEIRRNPIFDEPSMISVHLPPEMGHLTEAWNREGDNGILFCPFAPEANTEAVIRENLDLYGAILCDKPDKLYWF